MYFAQADSNEECSSLPEEPDKMDQTYSPCMDSIELVHKKLPPSHIYAVKQEKVSMKAGGREIF